MKTCILRYSARSGVVCRRQRSRCRLAAASGRRPAVGQCAGRRRCQTPLGLVGAVAADRRHLRRAGRGRRQGLCHRRLGRRRRRSTRSRCKSLWTFATTRRPGQLQQRRRPRGHRQVPARRHHRRLLLRARSGDRRSRPRDRLPASRSSRRRPPARTASISRRSGRRSMPSSPTASRPGPGTSSRRSSSSTATAGAAWTGCKERAGPRQLEGPFRLLARHLPDRQDHRHARRRPDRVPRGRRQRAQAAPPSARFPNYDGDEYPATFGQSADAAGNVYVQWHRRDNAGRVEILQARRRRQAADRFRRGHRDRDPPARPAELRLRRRPRRAMSIAPSPSRAWASAGTRTRRTRTPSGRSPAAPTSRRPKPTCSRPPLRSARRC